MRGDGGRFIREHPVILILLITVPVCLAAGLATGISGLLGGKEGLPGYISSWVWRLAVSLGILATVLYMVIRGMNAGRRKGASAVRTVFMALGAAACLLLVIWLFQAPIRDIPYLASPESIYVRQSSYDVSSGESPGCYCVEGISAEGEGVGFCEPGRGQYDGRFCVRTRREPL